MAGPSHWLVPGRAGRAFIMSLVGAIPLLALYRVIRGAMAAKA